MHVSYRRNLLRRAKIEKQLGTFLLTRILPCSKSHSGLARTCGMLLLFGLWAVFGFSMLLD